ncbi:NAD(P)/FAD-dependent oxidoreductase [Kovacikia minuta CCNUW1]|uniref:phytoene desaturase family protein n=1 Tax=Kovacikia minuta TaxID=2931930 RepID=UPI001CCEB622|nr:NAD(P)/FAD-dependent oxidoreductase [Kovacikia minuta]UBF26909.1 NAD(P)/FAD-dependent oxidoreductase [Kovacikia minuta CCNUW1]
METVDVVVVGSGIGGLCCAALLARYGFQVVVCESHNIPGGAAHTFERQGFYFDSGPSLYSGLSYTPSANPLRQVLDAIGEDISWLTYDAWGCFLPEGYFRAAVGAEPFIQILEQWRGADAVAEWQHLQQVMAPLKAASIAIPPIAVRSDWGILSTLYPFLPNIWRQTGSIFQLSGSFSQLLEGVVHDPFIRIWLDLLCFMLSGLPAKGTLAAEMAFMFADWYRPDVVLDYPQGGGGALIGALVRGLERWGGRLQLQATVQQILVDRQRAVGVQLKTGEQIYARHAVVSNASSWDTAKLLPETAHLPALQKRQNLPTCPSFMHLHLGIDGTGLPPDLECHYLIVNDWACGVDAPQNVVAVSIPSVLDSSLAPAGKHCIHAYTPATEPYELWAGINRQSDRYQQLKTERAQVLWQGLERIIPDLRERCEVTLVGTPLTHERFLRRNRGSYGPAIPAGKGMFPGCKTPLKGLLSCGDSTFPGIGVPAVAASGMIAANTLASVSQHRGLITDVLGERQAQLSERAK